jgi:hypothetical protein
MISRIANLVASFESWGFLLTLILGVALLGYTCVLWLIHWLAIGSYLLALTTAFLLCLLVTFAFRRVPLAQILVFGSAIICGTAFFLGHGNLLLP